MTASSRWEPVRLTAWRELSVRSHDKGFLISTFVSVLAIVGFIVIPPMLDKPDKFTVGVSGEQSPQWADGVAQAADQASVHVTLRRYPTSAAARKAVHDGDIDAAVINGRSVLVLEEMPERLEPVITQATTATSVYRQLSERGITRAHAQRILSQRPLPVRALRPKDAAAEGNEHIATVGIFLLFGQIMSYTFWVASGVVEEKATHVVEIILSAIKPWQLLTGKVIGIGLLGFAQLVLVGGAALGAAVASDVVTLDASAAVPISLVIGGFLLAYAFYACLYAAAAATVSRQEELGNVTAPLQIVLFASALLAFNTLNSSSIAAKIASFFPATAPLVMPPRVAGGDVSTLEVVVAVLVTLAATAALLPIAGRVYAGAVLESGSRVRLSDAWTTQDRPHPRSKDES
jgi:ABC-2 type transport system permease protein